MGADGLAAGAGGPSAPSPERTRGESRDARAVRTRRRIVEGYLKASAPGRELPRVSDVVRAAGVNRSSFYAHFDHIADLTLYVLDEALEDLSRSEARLAAKAKQPTRLTAVAAGSAYLDAIAANRRALSVAVRFDPAQARRRIGATIQRTMLEFLTHLPGWDPRSTRSRAIAAFVGHGWAGTICAWLSGELDLDRKVLLLELVALNPDPTRIPEVDPPAG